MKVPGIACILTYEDVPQDRFTMAGQTYPEFSPYDRLILDRRMRFVGDAAAIVAGETEKAVDRALKIIKVKYKVLEPVLDFHKAKDNAVCIHPEDNWESRFPVGADNKRNLCAHAEEGDGDVEKILADCDCVVERTYHTKANQQAMMETFRTAYHMDALRTAAYRRLHPGAFPCAQNRGGGPWGFPSIESPGEQAAYRRRFGAKQTAGVRGVPGLRDRENGKTGENVFSRYESQTVPPPDTRWRYRCGWGGTGRGSIRAIDVYTLSNTGAYGEHGPTTVGLSGHKSIPLYRDQRHTALRMTWCTPTRCRRALTGDTELPRESSRWNRGE